MENSKLRKTAKEKITRAYWTIKEVKDSINSTANYDRLKVEDAIEDLTVAKDLLRRCG